MIKFLPLLLAVGYALISLRFSVWQTKRTLAAQSRPLLDAALEPVFARMAAALELDRIKVNLFDIDPVNALAAPDGQIYVTRGMYQRFRAGQITDREMASVIAHELGHVALGHVRRRMVDFTGQNAMFVVLSAILNRFVPILGIWIANFISTVLMARLSRRDEFEADEWASALMIKAGIGTAPQKALFGKLSTLTGGTGEGIPAWVRSHPKPEDRIRAIEVNEARWGG
jgi:putative metalloprotease